MPGDGYVIINSEATIGPANGPGRPCTLQVSGRRTPGLREPRACAWMRACGRPQRQHGELGTLRASNSSALHHAWVGRGLPGRQDRCLMTLTTGHVPPSFAATQVSGTAMPAAVALRDNGYADSGFYQVPALRKRRPGARHAGCRSESTASMVQHRTLQHHGVHCKRHTLLLGVLTGPLARPPRRWLPSLGAMARAAPLRGTPPSGERGWPLAALALHRNWPVSDSARSRQVASWPADGSVLRPCWCVFASEGRAAAPLGVLQAPAPGAGVLATPHPPLAIHCHSRISLLSGSPSTQTSTSTRWTEQARSVSTACGGPRVPGAGESRMTWWRRASRAVRALSYPVCLTILPPSSRASRPCIALAAASRRTEAQLTHAAAYGTPAPNPRYGYRLAVLANSVFDETAVIDGISNAAVCARIREHGLLLQSVRHHWLQIARHASGVCSQRPGGSGQSTNTALACNCGC